MRRAPTVRTIAATPGESAEESPLAIHAKVEAAFNSQDLDGLVALYGPDAVMSTLTGTATGLDEIRENRQSLLDLHGHMDLTSRYDVRFEDLALIRNDYVVRAGDLEFTGATAEVVRRRPDGTWRYIIDNPFGVGELP